MQVAINQAGYFRILLGAFLAAITRPFGIKGIFYRVAGNGVFAIDGFNQEAFSFYQDKGILAPKNPCFVCDKIYEKIGCQLCHSRC